MQESFTNLTTIVHASCVSVGGTVAPAIEQQRHLANVQAWFLVGVAVPTSLEDGGD